MDTRLIRVLLVEDDEDDFVLTRDFLRDSRRSRFELDWVSTYDEAVAAILSDVHDIYLLDFRLGERDGLEILRRTRDAGCQKPIILLTGQGDGDIDIEAMKAGAADYLVKGQIDAQVLERSIRYALEQNRTMQALRESAFHDALTGLPNRALFMDRLERALQAALRHPERLFAVLFMDLDRFKIVNDSLGHLLGDQLLIAVAERVKKVVRAADTVARLGGDEFTILLDGLDHITDSIRTAKRIQEELQVPFKFGENEIFTTASIGVALSPTGYEKAEDILRDADLAMYRAKAAGKARHEVFDKTMHERAVKLLQFENELRRAIERKELRVHYQPIVALGSGEISGFEALLRWQRGDTLVSADEIIPVAEETGLIVPIGEWVLRESLLQLSKWRRAGMSNALQMHVNLSARQFLQPNLIEQIAGALSDAEVEAEALHLEVTESVLIDNAGEAAELIRLLRKVKVHVSLDDFGTGYSSLASLRQFPFDTLKIDRSFISKNGDAKRNDEIVRTIGMLARTLGMRVTVEGLETAGQVERMRALELDFAQGFYFSRPLDSGATGILLQRSSPLPVS